MPVDTTPSRRRVVSSPFATTPRSTTNNNHNSNNNNRNNHQPPLPFELPSSPPSAPDVFVDAGLLPDHETYFSDLDIPSSPIGESRALHSPPLSFDFLFPPQGSSSSASVESNNSNSNNNPNNSTSNNNNNNNNNSSRNEFGGIDGPGSIDYWLNTPALDPCLSSPASTSLSDYTTPPQTPGTGNHSFSNTPHTSPLKPQGLFPNSQDILCVQPNTINSTGHAPQSSASSSSSSIVSQDNNVSNIQNETKRQMNMQQQQQQQQQPTSPDGNVNSGSAYASDYNEDVDTTIRPSDNNNDPTSEAAFQNSSFFTNNFNPHNHFHLPNTNIQHQNNQQQFHNLPQQQFPTTSHPHQPGAPNPVTTGAGPTSSIGFPFIPNQFQVPASDPFNTNMNANNPVSDPVLDPGYTSSTQHSPRSTPGPTRRRHQRCVSFHNFPYANRNTQAQQQNHENQNYNIHHRNSDTGSSVASTFSSYSNPTTTSSTTTTINIPSSVETSPNKNMTHRRVISGPATIRRLKPGPRPKNSKSSSSNANTAPPSTSSSSATSPSNLHPPLPSNALSRIEQYSALSAAPHHPNGPTNPNIIGAPSNPPAPPPPSHLSPHYPQKQPLPPMHNDNNVNTPPIISPRPRRAAAANKMKYLDVFDDMDPSEPDIDSDYQGDDIYQPPGKPIPNANNFNSFQYFQFDPHQVNQQLEQTQQQQQQQASQQQQQQQHQQQSGITNIPITFGNTQTGFQTINAPLDKDGVVSRELIQTLYRVELQPKSQDPNGTARSPSSSKRYVCLVENCSRSFPRKTAIVNHIQTHLDNRPFVCPHPDCDAAFVRQHDLRRHSRTHSDNKPFVCPCGKKFARGDALMRHRQRGICNGSVVPRRIVSAGAPRSRH